MRDYMTLKEVAKAFKVNPRTINRWVRAGKLETIQYPGRTYRFDREYIQSLTK